MSHPLKNKTMMITGATRGLGLELALAGARNGAHIIAIGRTIGALEDLDDQIKQAGASATLIPLDLMQLEAIDALGPSLFPHHDQLDIFVSNAAYLGGLSPLTHTKTEEWQKTIQTNLSANFALIRTLTPLLQRAGQAQALFITDNQADNRDNAYWAPYNASKAGLEALVRSYAGECSATNVKAALLNPPPMATSLRRKAYPGEDATAIHTPAQIADTILKLLIENQFENGAVIQIP